jgi:cytochrome c-type biogenesis protein CcmH
MKGIILIALALFVTPLLWAKNAAPLAEDPEVEQRLIHIAEELRCLVCQNESLAGSRAELAEDLRREVRDLIRQGQSDDQIKEFLVSRYGDFVLYRPPVRTSTWLLWGGPFVFAILGVILLIRFLRRRAVAVTATELSDEERRRAEALLKDNS